MKRKIIRVELLSTYLDNRKDFSRPSFSSPFYGQPQASPGLKFITTSNVDDIG
jgi:hypothetical protein